MSPAANPVLGEWLLLWQSPLKPPHYSPQPCDAALMCPCCSALLTLSPLFFPAIYLPLEIICLLPESQHSQKAEPAGQEEAVLRGTEL